LKIRVSQRRSRAAIVARWLAQVALAQLLGAKIASAVGGVTPNSTPPLLREASPFTIARRASDSSI